MSRASVGCGERRSRERALALGIVGDDIDAHGEGEFGPGLSPLSDQNQPLKRPDVA
jgi:hypothetical protein